MMSAGTSPYRDHMQKPDAACLRLCGMAEVRGSDCIRGSCSEINQTRYSPALLFP